MLTKLVATALQAGVINDSMWQEYGLEKLENGISELFPRIEFSLGDLLAKVAQGEILSALGDLFQGIFSDVTTQMLGLRNVMVWLIVLGIVSALLSQFSDIFNHNQISDISFYFIYLLVVAVLLTCFWEVASVAMNMVENLILCIKLLVPTYVIAVGVSSGTTTVMAYYQLLLLLIYGVQSLLVGVLVPFIYSYIMLSVVNGVWIEEKLSLLLDLIEKGIKGALKAAIWLVTGISVFQSLITPVVDSLKASAVQKAFSVLPGIGDAADGLIELVVGSAVVIKNSIGVVMLLLLILVCCAPLLEILLCACMLKIAAAFMGIVSDKRISSCANRVGEGSLLLFRTTGTALILFLIAISVVAIATNRGF